MYKLLLCWRYLRTRWIALASIVSVTLGVWIMIVVNSVMSGFTTEMQDRIHGVLSDVIFESRSLDGFPDPEARMAEIRAIAGEHIEGMTPTVVVPAALCIESPTSSASYTMPIQLVGIDMRTQGSVGDFLKYLQHPENRKNPSFQLRENGYDTVNWQSGDEGIARPDMKYAGWGWRRRQAEMMEMRRALDQPGIDLESPHERPDSTGGADSAVAYPDTSAAASSGDGETITLDPNFDPFQSMQPEESQGRVFDPAKEQHAGAILGISIVAQREKRVDPETGETHREEWFPVIPGDDVTICVPTVGVAPSFKPSFQDCDFTIVDFYECKMSEYDSSFVFVPLEKLQDLRGMKDPETGVRYATQILIKVKDGHDIDQVRDKLREAFPGHFYAISTWKDKQSALLAAVQVEVAILNVLLFMIILVSGFGILAIFYMIVVEKTRDIGILKSLGASGSGVMQIFLGYGLSLGLLGAGVGLICGLVFVRYINEIADVLAVVLGHEVFDPQVYYFYKIPAIVNPWTVVWIMVGAILIAVSASVLPALRAARMHPVRALRYE